MNYLRKELTIHYHPSFSMKDRINSLNSKITDEWRNNTTEAFLECSHAWATEFIK